MAAYLIHTRRSRKRLSDHELSSDEGVDEDKVGSDGEMDILEFLATLKKKPGRYATFVGDAWERVLSRGHCRVNSFHSLPSPTGNSRSGRGALLATNSNSSPLKEVIKEVKSVCVP